MGDFVSQLSEPLEYHSYEETGDLYISLPLLFHHSFPLTVILRQCLLNVDSEVGFTGVCQRQQKYLLEDGGDRKDSRKNGKGVIESTPRVESDGKECYI